VQVPDDHVARRRRFVKGGEGVAAHAGDCREHGPERPFSAGGARVLYRMTRPVNRSGDPMSLVTLIPDAETVLALPPEELAFYLLQDVMQMRSANQNFHPMTIQSDISGGVHGMSPSYPPQFAMRSRLPSLKRGNGSKLNC
jgi:hypothetical protein